MRLTQLSLVAALVLPPFAALTSHAQQPAPQTLLATVFVYCTCWTLPGLGLQELRFGYVPLPRYFVRDFRNIYRTHGWQTIDRGW